MANAGLFNEYDPLQRIATNQYGMSANTITRGSLISFSYPRSMAMIPNIIHDPYPMVILTDVWPNYIRGLNLHYLTFPYIKRILTTHGGDGNFQYSHIKPDAYMANAFRMYVRQGVIRPKKLDTEWLIGVLQSVRSFAPGEVEKIRENIQKQIQARLQAKVSELEAFEQWKKSMTKYQQRQLNTKVKDIQGIVTGGQQQNLIVPNEGKKGFPPANISPKKGEGGPTSTQPNV